MSPRFESLANLIQIYVDYLKTTDFSDWTVTGRTSRLNVFCKWTEDEENLFPQNVDLIKAKHLRSYLAYRKETVSPGTRFQDYIALKTFFDWVTTDPETKSNFTTNPMEYVKVTKPKNNVVKFIESDVIVTVIEQCNGGTFIDIRDRAILCLYRDTGARASELIKTEEKDYSFDEQYVRITGKGKKERIAPFGEDTRDALLEYAEVRAEHTYRDSRKFFIGQQGSLTYQGVWELFAKRCRNANVERHHLHEIRHLFAHHWLSQGGNEGALMEILGHKTREMLDLYGASLRQERAIAEYHNKNMSPVDASMKRGPKGNERGNDN